MTSLIRITSTVFVAGAMVLGSAVVPATGMSMGGGSHAGMSAAWRSPLQAGPDFASRSHSTTFRANSVINNGAVVLTKKKKAGKLNGACYRSCVKTSMGDAFRTDQFCAYSCSLD